MTYTFHDKVVTLQLARLSSMAEQNQGFFDALSKLPDLGFDVSKLSQIDQEVLFAEFDSEMEAKIKAEFSADPKYLIDLGHANGVCPLCGHIGCRYLFRIRNEKNGKTIECGSDCIITHGLSVKGSETEEHARKALELTIRRHIRKLKIEAWHKETGFTPAQFETLAAGLWAISRDMGAEADHNIKYSARVKVRRDLRKLVRFYERTGWLNTEKKWMEWTRLVAFARNHNPTTKHSMSHPLPWGVAKAESEAEPVKSPTKDESTQVAVSKDATPNDVMNAIVTGLVFG